MADDHIYDTRPAVIHKEHTIYVIRIYAVLAST